MIVVRDNIEEIVLSIKSSGSVTNWVDNTGSYTVTTSDLGNLSTGLKVVLQYADTTLNRDVVLTSIDSVNKTFTFSGTGITEAATWEMALYFQSGHQKELHKKYTNKAKSINKRVQEYPLIWLFKNYEKEANTDGGYIDFSTDLAGAIADFTEIDLYDEQRIEETYKPVLYPIFDLLDTAFNTGSNKQKFVIPFGQNGIKLTQIDRPFFGSETPEANILPQITDAIEWGVSLDWFVEKNNCQQT